MSKQKCLSLLQKRLLSTQTFRCGPYNKIADNPEWYRPVSQEIYKYYKHGNINLYSQSGFDGMAKAGKLAGNALRHLCEIIRPGITTMDIADETKDFIESHNGVPTSIGFCGFPASICTSNNSIACHGVPKKDEILKEGDIIKCDVTCSVDGWHGDTCYTYYVSDDAVNAMNKETAMFLYISQKSRDIAIEYCKPGNQITQIGNVIEKFLIETMNSNDINGVKKTSNTPQIYTVLTEYTGHGIGRYIHESPEVSNAPNPTNKQGHFMFPGMCFTIEPILLLNPPPPRKDGKMCYIDSDDQWSVIVTNTTSAQFEHCIGITESGYQIFTLPDKPYPDIWNQVLDKYRKMES